MSARTRTRNVVERLDFLRAVDLVRKDEALDADVRAAEARLFRPLATAWVAASAAHREATAADALAQDAADEAKRAFDLAVRRWGVTVRDEDGRSLAARLTPLLGGHSLSQLAKRSPGEGISRMNALFERLAGEPTLQGDPARLAELKAATAALDPLAAAADRACRARLARRKELDAVEDAYDNAVAQLHRAFAAFLGVDKARELLPVFTAKAPAPVTAPVPASAKPAEPATPSAA